MASAIIVIIMSFLIGCPTDRDEDEMEQLLEPEVEMQQWDHDSEDIGKANGPIGLTAVDHDDLTPAQRIAQINADVLKQSRIKSIADIIELDDLTPAQRIAQIN